MNKFEIIRQVLIERRRLDDVEGTAALICVALGNVLIDPTACDESDSGPSSIFRCPTCDSYDRRLVGFPVTFGPCSDPWHGKHLTPGETETL